MGNPAARGRSTAARHDSKTDSLTGPERRTRSRSAARRRANRRTVVLTVVFLLIIGLALWGADWLGRIVAQSVLAGTVQEQTGVSTRPVVDIHGTFFLPQVVRGRYSDVTVDLTDLTSGPLRIHTLHAELRGVHVPFHDVLVGHSNQVVVDEADEDALVTYQDVNSYLAYIGRPVTMAPTQAGTILLTFSAEILGRKVTATAEATISSQDGLVAVRPTELLTGTVLDRASQLLLGDRLTFLIPMDPLPFGQQVTSIQSRPDGLLIHARGTHMVLTP